MKTFSEIQTLVNQAIEKEAKIIADKQPHGLYQPISYILEAGGKRLRPILVLMANNLFTNKIDGSLSPAIAFEVFHNFTLIHDDIMDKADLRRNRATVHKKWDENTAILSGDASLIVAYQFLAKAPDFALAKLLDLFNQTAVEVCEGQQYDMEFETQEQVSATQYLEMIRLKTSVLVAACLKAGAILGKADADDAENLYQFGLNLGLAFQLRDDYLDVYGDVKTFGKKIGNDIVSNKKTYLLIKALEQSSDNQLVELKSLLRDKQISAKEKIEKVSFIYAQLKIKEQVNEKIGYFYEKALGFLKKLTVSSEKKEGLLHLAKKLNSREQ